MDSAMTRELETAAENRIQRLVESQLSPASSAIQDRRFWELSLLGKVFSLCCVPGSLDDVP